MKKSHALLGVALVVGLQIPITIEKISDGPIKVMVQLLAVLVLIYCCGKVDFKEISDSIRPPK